MKNIFEMSNAEFDSWAWRWFKGWAVALAFIIITANTAHGWWSVMSQNEVPSTSGGQTASSTPSSWWSGLGGYFRMWIY